MDVEFGNAGIVDTHGTGWFVGFSDWAKSGPANLRHIPIDTTSSGLCVKWFAHAAGHPAGEVKPISDGRTMSILVGATSEFRIEFCRHDAFDPALTLCHTLRQPGDFVIWGAGLYHRAFGLKDATVLTVRWSLQA
jgi:hypothetical protein